MTGTRRRGTLRGLRVLLGLLWLMGPVGRGVAYAQQDEGADTQPEPRLMLGTGRSACKFPDDALWQRLMTRAVRRPTRMQTAQIGPALYKIFVVRSATPVPEQKCPEGTRPSNTFFVSKPAEGPGGDVYPVRLRVACVGGQGIEGSFTLNAELDGTMLDWSLLDGALGVSVRPECDAAFPKNRTSSGFSAFLTRLAKYFLNVR